MPIKLPETPEEVGLPDFHVTKSPRNRRIQVVRALGFVSLAVVGCVFTGVLTGRNLSSLFGHKALSSTNWPVPSDISLDSCDTWTKHPGWFWQRSSAEATFSIPTDISNLLVLSRGANIGRFRVVGRHDDGDDIQVIVHATYPHGTALEDSIRVCTIGRADGEHGLGLFTEDSRTALPDIDIEAWIRLPLAFNSTLRLPKLEMDLLTKPDVWMVLPSDRVEFDEVVLKSDSGDVRAYGPIRTKRAQLQVANHYVAGNLQVLSEYTHEYHLKNGPIEYADARVDVEPSPTSKGSLYDQFGNGPNKTFAHTIRLGSGDKLRRLQGDLEGPFSFDVSSPEFLSLYLAYDFPHPYRFQPGCYPRSFACKELDITPPVTFLGRFNISTALVPTEVRLDGNPDPMGIGRKRNIKLEGVGSEKTTGIVGWEDNGFKDEFDTVEFNVVTSLSPSLLLP